MKSDKETITNEQTGGGNPKTSLESLLDFLKDPKSEETHTFLFKFLKNVAPHPLYKVIGDIMIAGSCILAIIYCANHGFVAKENVQSLLALVIGAVIGSRFKN
jgi:hypothetical protein